MGKQTSEKGSKLAQKGLRATAETDLYIPVKAWLERKGFTVRGEVKGCDVVGVREGEPWPVVVEMKKRFNLSLFLQAVERTSLTPFVYVAAEKTEGTQTFSLSELTRLCRLLGLGLITVKLYQRKPALVEEHCMPNEGQARGIGPQRPGRRTAKLLSEFGERSGDHNAGGGTGRKLVTAYREKALRCADVLSKHGPLAPRQVKDLIGSEKAVSILQTNVYGWFHRVERGIYTLTPEGEAALVHYADVVALSTRR